MSPRRQITYSRNPTRAARSAHAKGEKAFRTYDTSYIRPKRSPIPAILGVIVLVAALAAILWGVMQYMKGCSTAALLPSDQSAQITVVDGDGPKAVGKALADAGLIESQNVFVDRCNEMGSDFTLQPGTYTIQGGTPLDDIIAMLSKPVAASVTFTVPEGSTVAQTADIIAEASGGRITAEDFIAAASNASVYAESYPFLAEAGEYSLEGFLFPKTYPIADDATAESLVRLMLDQYAAEISGLDWSYVDSMGMTQYDALKLASIVEKEAAVENRATVASVFYNRIAAGMQLQSDATVAYVVGHDPTPEDIETWSDYNTYLIDGLPPTPINSPSIECLQAVCSPEETPYYYFYFEPDENGVMVYSFSETYEEHQATYE